MRNHTKSYLRPNGFEAVRARASRELDIKQMNTRPDRVNRAIHKCFDRYVSRGGSNAMTLAEICFWVTDPKLSCGEIHLRLIALERAGVISSLGPFWIREVQYVNQETLASDTCSDVVSN